MSNVKNIKSKIRKCKNYHAEHIFIIVKGTCSICKNEFGTIKLDAVGTELDNVCNFKNHTKRNHRCHNAHDSYIATFTADSIRHINYELPSLDSIDNDIKFWGIVKSAVE